MKDVMRWSQDTTTLDIAAGDVTGSRQSAITRKLARVWAAEGVVSIGVIGDTPDTELWGRCVANTVAARPVTVPPPAAPRGERFEAPTAAPVELEAAVSAMLEVFQREHPSFIPQGKFTFGRYEREYTSAGQSRFSAASKLDGYLYFKHRASANIIDHVVALQANTPAALADLLPPQHAWLRAWEQQSQLPAGKYPVCFTSPEELWGKLLPSLNPEVYHAGAGLLSGKAGKLLFHPDLTLSDVAMHAPQGNWRPFDDEGTLRDATHDVIRDGVFTGPLYDLRTAHKFGQRSSGHALRNPQGGAAVVPHELQPRPGALSMSALLGAQEDCVVVLLGGGGDTTADGEFSMPTQVAFHVRAGKVLGQLPSLTVRANLRDYFGGDFIGVASDPFYPGLAHPLLARMEIILN